jgi:hypothetical protein
MLNYIPLHLSALEHSNALMPWIQSWFQPSENVTFLQPLDWFTTGHQAGSHVWSPPPGVADVALEQLAIAIHKRPLNHHVVIIPRLMTAAWKKLLGKICDLVITVPLGVPFWPDSHFEPLLLGLYFPLLPCSPWQLRFTHLLDGLAQQLSGLPRSSHNWGGSFAPTSRPSAEPGQNATEHGTEDVMWQQIMGNSLLLGHRTKRGNL